jgi:predicted amidohydrolase
MDDSMKLKIAGVQMEPKILEKERNLSRCLELIQGAAASGAGLIVFPECALTGYMYSSLQEALPVCEPVPGPSTTQITGLCRDLNVHVVVGLLEIDDDNCYNSAVLLGPAGLLGRYRKIHLPYLGIDRFISSGSSAPDVFDTPIGSIGIGICYDAMFPEHARILALQGADILVLPTNWPEQREFIPEHVIPARAAENHIFIIAVNRIGEERGSRFIGHSIIAHWGKGTALATGQPGEETTIYAEIDPVQAREKHVIINPGEFEFDVLRDRRPELYNVITTPPHPRNIKHAK